MCSVRYVEIGSVRMAECDGGVCLRFFIWQWSMFCSQLHQKNPQMLAFWLANTTALSLHLRQRTGDNQVRGLITTCNQYS